MTVPARRRGVTRYRAAAGGGALPVTDTMIGWWKGDTGVTASGGKVSAWADQSGTGNHLAQATAGSQPSTGNTMNGLPVVTFPGAANVWVATAAGITGTVFTCLAVLRRSSTSADTVIHAGPTTGGRQLRTFQSKLTIVRGLQAVPVQGATVLGTATNYVAAWRYNGSTSTVTLNNTLDGSASGSQAFATGGGIAIGARLDGNETFYGDIAEIVLYGRALTNTEQASVGFYLGSRYGITVA